jgi:hypothetical protein
MVLICVAPRGYAECALGIFGRAAAGQGPRQHGAGRHARGGRHFLRVRASPGAKSHRRPVGPRRGRGRPDGRPNFCTTPVLFGVAGQDRPRHPTEDDPEGQAGTQEARAEANPLQEAACVHQEAVRPGLRVRPRNEANSTTLTGTGQCATA